MENGSIEGVVGSASAKSSCAEELDPRIHLELERLNISTTKINQLEKAIDETNEQFRLLLSSHAGEIEKLMRKLGRSIDIARPFYIAKKEAEELKKKCLEAAVHFQRANDMHKEAKKSVLQAEGRYNNESHFDSSSQELLNHLTIQVVEAEKTKTNFEVAHKTLCSQYTAAEKKQKSAEKLLQRDIEKSMEYWAKKEALNSVLDDLKLKSLKLSSDVAEQKRVYREALNRLEMISNEIHRERRKRMPGEGAEQDGQKEADDE